MVAPCHKAGMKKQTQSIPTVSNYTILRQLSNLNPPHLVSKLARETGVADHERTFSGWSQTVALMFAHLTHAIGLNDEKQRALVGDLTLPFDFQCADAFFG